MKLSDLSAPPAPAHDDAASSTQVPLNDFEAATVSNPGSLPHIRAGSVGQRSRAGSMALSSTAASLAAAYRDDDADALFYTEDFTIANAHVLPDPVFDVGDTVARVASAARLCVYPEVTEYVREEASGWTGGAGVKGAGPVDGAAEAAAESGKDSPSVAAYEVDVAGASAALASLLIAAGGDVGLLRAAGEALIARSRAIDNEDRMALMNNLGLGSPAATGAAAVKPTVRARSMSSASVALSTCTPHNGALLPLHASSRNPFAAAAAPCPVERAAAAAASASVSTATYTCGRCAALAVVDAVRPPALTLNVDRPGAACAVFLPAQGDCLEYVKEAVKTHGLELNKLVEISAPDAEPPTPASVLSRLGCGDTDVALALPGATDRGLGITVDLLGPADAREQRPAEATEEAADADTASLGSEGSGKRPTPTVTHAHRGRGPGGAYLPSPDSVSIRVDMTHALTHGARMVKVGFGRTYHTHVKVTDDMRYLVWEVPGPDADLQDDSQPAAASSGSRQRLADLAQRASTYNAAATTHVNSFGAPQPHHQHYYSSHSFSQHLPDPQPHRASHAAKLSTRARSASSASQVARITYGQPTAAPLPVVPISADAPAPSRAASLVLADQEDTAEGELRVSSGASWSALMASQRVYADLSQPRTHRIYGLMYDVVLPRDIAAAAASPRQEPAEEGQVATPTTAPAKPAALALDPQMYAGLAGENTLRQSNVPPNCRAIPIESIVAIQAGTIHTHLLLLFVSIQNNLSYIPIRSHVSSPSPPSRRAHGQAARAEQHAALLLRHLHLLRVPRARAPRGHAR